MLETATTSDCQGAIVHCLVEGPFGGVRPVYRCSVHAQDSAVVESWPALSQEHPCQFAKPSA